MATTLVIPVRNNHESLIPMLMSLVEHAPNDPYDVIFIDCESTDGSIEMIRQLEGDFSIIPASSDSSLAHWVNIAVRTVVKGERIIVATPPAIFRFHWYQEIKAHLEGNVLGSLDEPDLSFIAFRLDFLRWVKGLDESLPKESVISDYVKRVSAFQEMRQHALTFNIPEHMLGNKVGESLSQVLAAGLKNPNIGELPEAAAERLRERLWMDEERQQLIRARGGRDVCWTDEGEREPLITVRIATYNRSEELMEIALPSALNQTYENLDILVVGDHTDDATVKAIESVRDRRVRFINLPAQALYPEHRHGNWMVHGSPAMNLGIELAAGSWIAPMDDDDAMTPDHVEVLLAAARDRRLEFVWSQTLMEMPDGWQVLGTEPLGPMATTSGAVMWSAGLRFMRMSTTCYKFDEPHDQNMWRRMHEIGVKMGFLKRITYRYTPYDVKVRKHVASNAVAVDGFAKYL